MHIHTIPTYQIMVRKKQETHVFIQQIELVGNLKKTRFCLGIITTVEFKNTILNINKNLNKLVGTDDKFIEI